MDGSSILMKLLAQLNSTTQPRESRGRAAPPVQLRVLTVTRLDKKCGETFHNEMDDEI